MWVGSAGFYENKVSATEPPPHPLGMGWVWGPPIGGRVWGSQAGVRGAPESQLRGLSSSCWSAAQGTGNHTTLRSGQAPPPTPASNPLCQTSLGHCNARSWVSGTARESGHPENHLTPSRGASPLGDAAPCWALKPHFLDCQIPPKTWVIMAQTRKNPPEMQETQV